MKKITLVSFSVLCLSFASNAQTKALQQAKIKTPTLHCEKCEARVESFLKRVDGVTYINSFYKKGETTVKFLTDRTNIEMIKAMISNAGYNADEVAANPEAFKILPLSCQKTVEMKPAQ